MKKLQPGVATPEPTSLPPRVVPLFPLPDHVLMPGVQVPYRVFEPRYRDLVTDLLEREPSERWLCVPRLAPGWRSDYHGRPAFHPVATAGLVVACEELDNGHYFLVVEGVARVRLDEVPSRAPFRLGSLEMLPDEPIGAGADALVRVVHNLVQAVYGLVALLGPGAEDIADAITGDVDVTESIYRLAMAVIDDVDVRQQLLEERSVLVRAREVLDATTALMALAGRHSDAVALA